MSPSSRTKRGLRRMVPLAIVVLGVLAFAVPAQAAPTAHTQIAHPHAVPPPPNLPILGNIVNYATGKCIGIATSGLAGDWTCTSNRDQTWYYGKSIDPVSHWSQLVNGNGKCLSLDDDVVFRGDRLIATTCRATDESEQWRFDQGAGLYHVGDYHPLENYRAFFDYAGLNTWNVGVSGGSTANGAAVILYTPLPVPNQIWYP